MLARERCTTDPSAGSYPAGRCEPEPAPAGRPSRRAWFAHGVPQQALCSLADHVPTDGVAITIPRSSVFEKLPSCTSGKRPASVTDERRIHQRLGANSSSVRQAGSSSRLVVERVSALLKPAAALSVSESVLASPVRGRRLMSCWSASSGGPTGEFAAPAARDAAAPTEKRTGGQTADEEKAFQRAKQVLVSSTVSLAASPSVALSAQLALPLRQPISTESGVKPAVPIVLVVIRD